MIRIDEHEFHVIWNTLSLLREEIERPSKKEVSYVYKDANGGRIARVVITDARSQIIIWDPSDRRVVFEMVRKCDPGVQNILLKGRK